VLAIETKNDSNNIFADVVSTVSSKRGMHSLGFILGWAWALYRTTIANVWLGPSVKFLFLPLVKMLGLFSERKIKFKEKDRKNQLLDYVTHLSRDDFKIEQNTRSIANEDKMIDYLTAMVYDDELTFPEAGYVMQKALQRKKPKTDSSDILVQEVRIWWNYFFTKGSIPVDYLLQASNIIWTGLYLLELKLFIRLIQNVVFYFLNVDVLKPAQSIVGNYLDSAYLWVAGTVAIVPYLGAFLGPYFQAIPSWIFPLLTTGVIELFKLAGGLFKTVVVDWPMWFLGGLGIGIGYAVTNVGAWSYMNVFKPDFLQRFEAWKKENRYRLGTSKFGTIARYIFDSMTYIRSFYNLCFVALVAFLYAKYYIPSRLGDISVLPDFDAMLNVINHVNAYLAVNNTVDGLPWYQRLFTG
jgi:uncharacterized membrane protein